MTNLNTIHEEQIRRANLTTAYDKTMRDYHKRLSEEEKQFHVPGAPQLTEYLRNHLEGDLFLLLKTCYWNWYIGDILHNWKSIGFYWASQEYDDPTDFPRSFTGRLPDYNEGVHLEWADKKYEPIDGEIVCVREGLWERNDNFLEIPFP